MAGMVSVAVVLVVLFSSTAPAQDVQPAGTATKLKVSGYPVHAKAGGVELGAEYMIRSIGDGGNWFATDDYLVVEVAVFPERGKSVTVSTNAFRLRVNGRKQEFYPQAPGMVAASLKYPDWTMKPRLEASAGLGDYDVIIGRPRPVERFPGDPRPQQGRLPRPPTTPVETPGGVERQPAAQAHEVAIAAALPEGETRGPVSGYVYFAWSGKTRSIKSLELIHRGDDGSVTVLRLI